MQELSMNILDIAENSVAANATLVQITLNGQTAQKLLTLTIQDNGKGMSQELVQRVTDPFCTSRTTRKVGLGLPFLKMAAQLTGGDMYIQSTVGVGTCVTATFTLGHIDLMPLGDVAGTVTTLIQCNPQVDFIYTLTVNSQSFCTDTRQLREILGDVPLSTPQVALFIKEYIEENSAELYTGLLNI
ncbi:MAG: ATP-binding protein [Oscillospiraceae bacterium]|nr:ATP-binding protein [Oscillospiraceae bacterium]